MKYKTHALILEWGWRLTERSGWEHIYQPSEVAMMDLTYLDELFRYDEGVQFFQDTDKREAGVFL